MNSLYLGYIFLEDIIHKLLFTLFNIYLFIVIQITCTYNKPIIIVENILLSIIGILS